jgi:hypothetical protein
MMLGGMLVITPVFKVEKQERKTGPGKTESGLAFPHLMLQLTYSHTLPAWLENIHQLHSQDSCEIRLPV